MQHVREPRRCRSSIWHREKQQAQQHSPGYLPTPRPGTTVRPESKSRIRLQQAARRPGSIRDAQREPAEEGTGAYRKMQASIILQGRSVHRARRVLPIEVRRSTEEVKRHLSPSPFCSCFLLLSLTTVVLVLAPARTRGRPADLRGDAQV